MAVKEFGFFRGSSDTWLSAAIAVLVLGAQLASLPSASAQDAEGSLRQESADPSSSDPADPSSSDPADPSSSDPADPATDGAQAKIPGEEELPAVPALELSLRDAIRRALENNLQIQVSRVDDRIRQRDVVVARAIFDPFFNLGFTYAKNREPSVSAIEVGNTVSQDVVTNPSEQTSYSVGLSGDWVLGTHYDVRLGQDQFDRPAASEGGITFLNPITTTSATVDIRQPLLKGAWYEVNTAGIRIAHNNALVSLEELERATMDVVFAVEQAYWEFVFATQNLESKGKALRLAQENESNVAKKHAVGALAAIDVTTARAQVSLRKVDSEVAWLLRETARDNLLDALNYSGETSLKERLEDGSGVAPYENVNVVCTTPPDLAGPAYGRARAIHLAFQNRPEYKQLGLNVDSQQIRTRVAHNDLLPSLDLLARWTQLGLEEEYDGAYRSLDSGRFYDWLVGVEFSIPLSNRANRSRYRNARSEVRRLQLQRQDLENQIVLEVEQALREIRSLVIRVRDLDESVRYHEELLQAEQRRLEVGKSVPYFVSEIENDLVDQQTRALRAKADLQTSGARLLRATGTTLQHHAITVGTR